MMTFALPVPVASAHNGFPHNDNGGCNAFGLGESITAAYKVNYTDQGNPVVYGILVTDVNWTIGAGPVYTQVGPATGTNNWFNYDYVGPGTFTLYGVVVAAAGGETGYVTSVDPGSVELPSNISHVVLCFVTNTTPTTTTTTEPPTTTTTTEPPTTTTTTEPPTTTTTTEPPTTTTTTEPPTTTTTTEPPTTTTTIGGPTTTTTTLGTTTTTIGGPTTTTTTLGSTTTTTLGGPCSPTDPECLPNTGGSNLMSVLLAGLGLLFVGVGMLAMADERRRVLAR